MRRSRLLVILFMVVTAGLVLGLTHPALADLGDVSVGGVWVCRIKNGAPGQTLMQRMVDVERRITEVLSTPRFRRTGVAVTVRPSGAGAAIQVSDYTVITVVPEDAAGTGVTTLELARQWSRRLVAGLNRALPDASFTAF